MDIIFQLLGGKVTSYASFGLDWHKRWQEIPAHTHPAFYLVTKQPLKALLALNHNGDKVQCWHKILGVANKAPHTDKGYWGEAPSTT